MSCFFNSFFSKLFTYKLKINIIGDVLIDEYYDVDVERISPEFP